MQYGYEEELIQRIEKIEANQSNLDIEIQKGHRQEM